jgi:hypothetical protein
MDEKAYKRAWRLKNRDKVILQRIASRDRRKKQDRERYLRNKDTRLQQMRSWQINNAYHYREYLRNYFIRNSYRWYGYRLKDINTHPDRRLHTSGFISIDEIGHQLLPSSSLTPLEMLMMKEEFERA